jgi:hypothetical protein
MGECIGKSHRDKNEIMVIDLIMLRIVSPRGKNDAPQSTNAEEHIRRPSALLVGVILGDSLSRSYGCSAWF